MAFVSVALAADTNKAARVSVAKVIRQTRCIDDLHELSKIGMPRGHPELMRSGLAMNIVRSGDLQGKFFANEKRTI